MLKNVMILGVIGLALSGCVGSPIGEMLTSEEEASARADKECQSMGAYRGSQSYVQCRMMMSQQRQNRISQGRMALVQMSQSLSDAADREAYRQRSYGNDPVTCDSYRYGPRTRTNCY